MPQNKILNSSNAALPVTNLTPMGGTTSTMEGVPLGTVGGGATGEIIVKVGIVDTGGTSTNVNALIYGQDAGNDEHVVRIDSTGAVQVAGTAVAPGTTTFSYAVADVAKLAVDKVSGAPLSYTRRSIRSTTDGDAVSADPRQYSTVSNFTIATADATVFTLADGEKGFIQNLDDAALAVKLGASASTTSLSRILQAGTAADDGKGGSMVIEDYVGAVSVAAMTGAARYIAYKLS